MLQTSKYIEYLEKEGLSFKSPRECYKPLTVALPLVAPLAFQVPKGMLQTYVSSKTEEFFVGFKSPRECYKLDPNTPFLHRLPQFQVPKGMLQTHSRPRGIPQGLRCFKSPRECYKLKDDRYLWSASI